MKLTLARYSAADSSGHWLVRQMPGICLVRDNQGWVVLYTGELARATTRGIWQAGAGLRKEYLSLTSNHPNPLRRFRTRREALDFLETNLSDAPASELGSLL